MNQSPSSKVLFLSTGRRHISSVMKQTMLFGAALLLPLSLSAHPHKGSVPQGELLTVAVATGSGTHTYKNVPWWGMAEIVESAVPMAE